MFIVETFSAYFESRPESAEPVARSTESHAKPTKRSQRISIETEFNAAAFLCLLPALTNTGLLCKQE